MSNVMTMSKKLPLLSLLVVLAFSSAGLALASRSASRAQHCADSHGDPQACQSSETAAGQAGQQFTGGGYGQLLPLVSRAGELQNTRTVADFIVTKTGDTDDGFCDADCSLREAVTAADSSPGADVVSFAIPQADPGCSSAGVCTIVLATEIGVSGADEVTINGLGGDITISGNNATRLIRVNTGGALSLQRLTLADGFAAAGGGGAIINSGSLTVSHSTFSGNSTAVGGAGGAIINSPGSTVSLNQDTFLDNSSTAGGAISNGQGGAMTISYTTFSQNEAQTRGGAISSYGSLTLSQSTFFGNRANHGGAIENGLDNATSVTLTISDTIFQDNSAANGTGGAIYNSGGNTVNLSQGTFSGNSAHVGGAIYHDQGGTMTVDRSTFDQNDANTFGGAISSLGPLFVNDSTFSGNGSIHTAYAGAIDNSGPLTVSNSTFSANRADHGGAISNQNELAIKNSTFSGNSALINGGAIAHYPQSGGTLDLSNSVLSGSSACDGFNIDMPAGGNLSDDSSCTTSPVDLRLGPLGDHGGPTLTHALLPGSPAVDAGVNNCPGATGTPLATDQRGIIRPIDGDGDGLARCDVGAYETNPQMAPDFVVNASADSDDGSCDEFIAGKTNCTLREAVTAANDSPGANDITFAIPPADPGCSPADVCTIRLGRGQLSATDPGGLIIDGTGANITISGGHSSRIFTVGAGTTLSLRMLTMSDGLSLASGGAILNLGSLSVSHSAFSGNNAETGGAIRNMAGGSLLVNNSTFSGNHADFAGAIGNLGTLAVSNSTFSGNDARFIGGAIRNSGTMHLGSSTFFGHSAATLGGTLANLASLSLSNSIVAGGGTGGAACEGSAIDNSGGNLSDDGSCPGFTTEDLRLGPLADNGGPTLTHALLPGSPAIDAGAAGCPDPAGVPLAMDQRGVARPQGAACDIGAFELENSPPVAADDAYSTLEDTPVLIEATANDSDADGNLLPSSAVVVSGPGHGSVANQGDGSFSYTPEANFSGSDSFVYQVCDSAGLCDQATVTISVVPVNDPPTISDGDLSLDPERVDEMAWVSLSGLFSDPEAGDSHTVTIDWGDGSDDTILDLGSQARSFSAAHQYQDDNPSGTAADENIISVTVADAAAAATASTRVVVTNVAPVVSPISGPTAPVNINDLPINVTAAFTDPGVLDGHTAVIAWGDGTSETASIPAGARDVNGSHVYAEPGVYQVGLRVTDDDLGSGESLFQYLIVYDPAGGFITGGGWIDSPAGAYAADPSFSGKAHFGFVSRYQDGATSPSGSIQFHFQTGDVNFRAASYDWLVIAGARATYQGMGTINGGGGYGFLLSAIDAALTTSTEVDLLRIRIWDLDNHDVPIYDSQVSCPDTALDADPCSPLGGGSIAIHN